MTQPQYVEEAMNQMMRHSDEQHVERRIDIFHR